jgi:SAM-dependent methyltransferase/uncharacterized protein YbaR (Trm112 family)
MKPSIIPILSCPSCKSPLKLTPDSGSESEITEGQLSCTGCGTTFPICGGVPSLLPASQRGSHVAKSFGFEWQTHHQGGFEKTTVFGRKLDEQVKYFFEGLAISEKDIAGKRILDAGCGSGVLTTEIARRYPTAEVVGMDINPAIAEVYRNGARLPNLHVVQASILEPPFAPGSFDLLWSNGVIHHTGNTRRAFDGLTTLVKSGGRAYFWVYEKKLSPMVGVRQILRPAGLVHWNHGFLYRVCQVLAFFTWLAVLLLRPLGKLKFVQRHTHLKILTLRRGFRELELTWFDVLSPMYRDTYTQREFESWFEQHGFRNLTRYWWPVGVSGTKTGPDGQSPSSPDVLRRPEDLSTCAE